RDDGLDHVVGDRGGDDPPHAPFEHGAAGGGQRPGAEADGGHEQVHPSGEQQVGSTVTTSLRRSSSAGARWESASRYQVRRPSGIASTRPHPRRHASWFDMTWRETPSASARSDGYAGASRSVSMTRARVSSDRACPRRASAAVWVSVTVSITTTVHERVYSA